MTAQFKVLDGTQVINQMVVEYDSPKELNDIFHAVRKEWAEYMVEVENEYMTMTYSHPYAEEVRRGWA
jgi:hypothetical protein